jgi:transglutaminase-like putative cysteine protease
MSGRLYRVFVLLALVVAGCGRPVGPPIPWLTPTAGPTPTSAPPQPTTTPTTALPIAGNVLEEHYYACEIGGQTVGYFYYRLLKRDAAILRAESRFLLQTELQGEAQTLQWDAVTEMDAAYRPLAYRVVVQQGKAKTEVDAAFQGGEARVTVSQRETRQEKSISLPGEFFLLDNNIFDHYAYLVRRIEIEPGQRAVSLFVPQAAGVLTITAALTEGSEPLVLAGKEYMARVLTLDGPFAGMTIWLTEAGELLQVDIPMQNAVIRLADRDIVGRLNTLDMFSFLLETKFTRSNVQFTGFANVMNMKAWIKVDVSALEAGAVGEEVLTYRGQQFEGKVSETARLNDAASYTIEGTVTTRVERYEGEESPPYPFRVTPSLAAYLKEADKVEADDLQIAVLARELTAEARDAWEASVLIADWVYKNIHYELTGAGAKETLETRVGDCGSHSMLMAALARAAGIPTRIVGGFMFANGSFGQHYWNEVYMDAAGWVPIDTTVGEIGYLDATHVRLWLGANAGLNRIEVEVLEYEDIGLLARPETPVLRALALRAGDRKAWRLTVQSKELATVRYEVVGQEIVDGAMAWRLRSHLALDDRPAGGRTQMNVDDELLVNERGEPLHYTLRVVVNGQPRTVDVEFRQGAAYAKIVAGGRTIEQEVVTSSGTFLPANNMIG